MTMTIGGTSGLVFPDSSTQNTAATGFGFKNRIINGAMMIDQRNAGASVTPTANVYSVDRWMAISDASSKYNIQQVTDAPTGFSYSLKATSLSAYSVGSTELFGLWQWVEGYNSADFSFGSANAKTVTLSFWVKSSLTGTFGGSIQNSDYSYGYPFSFTISAANTWEQKTVTITGATSGSWLTTNGRGLLVCFSLGAGSSRVNTAGAWTSTQFSFSATGATSVVGTNGATFYITGVQLEKGSTATSFDYRPYGTELALCQRYGLALNDPIGAFIDTTNTYQGPFCFPVEMRAAPTLASGATYTVSGGSAGTPAIRNTASQPTTTKSVIFYNSASNWAAGNNAKVTGFLSAEL